MVILFTKSEFEFPILHEFIKFVSRFYSSLLLICYFQFAPPKLRGKIGRIKFFLLKFCIASIKPCLWVEREVSWWDVQHVFLFFCLPENITDKMLPRRL